MLQIEVHPDVYDEIEQARTWYEQRASGLGDDFIDEVNHAIESVRRSPETWPIYTNEVRRFLVHRFPYAVLYRYKDAKVQIFAVMHLRRKPGYWKDRKF